MHELFNKLFKRHKWSLHQKLARVDIYECTYCWDCTWRGDRSVLPVGLCTFVYPNTRCDRRKVTPQPKTGEEK